jgi:hypothetical protein
MCNRDVRLHLHPHHRIFSSIVTPPASPSSHLFAPAQVEKDDLLATYRALCDEKQLLEAAAEELQVCECTSALAGSSRGWSQVYQKLSKSCVLSC